MTVYVMRRGSLFVLAPWAGQVPSWMRGHRVIWLDLDGTY